MSLLERGLAALNIVGRKPLDGPHPQDQELEQSVTPWDVKGAIVDGVAKPIDYGKLIRQFGVSEITPELIERFEKVTGHKAHHLVRRGIFFAHR